MTSSYHPKRFTLFAFVVSLVVASLIPWGCAPTYGTRTHTTIGVGVNATYSELTDWGYWNVNARFGDVWIPYVEPGWAPFTYGNWVWTDQGWLWSSYEPYGWLVFHYGNWYYDDGIGWFWIPGYSWSTAPVQWYVYDDYICWAPRPPSGYSWASPWETKVTFAWTSVSRSSFLNDDVGSHKVAIRPPSKSGDKFVKRRSPDIKVIAQLGDQKPERVKIQREKVKMENKTFYKAVLPDRQNEKIAQYKNKYKKVQGPEKENDNKGGKKEKPFQGGKPDNRE